MNKGQLLVMEMGLNRVIELTKATKNLKLKYLFAYNRDAISNECSLLKKLDVQSEKFSKFQEERLKLNEEYAIKVEGKAVIENRHYKIDPTLIDIYTKNMNDLEANYKDVIKERTEQVEVYNKYLQEPVDETIMSKFKKIKLAELEKEEGLSEQSIDLFSSLLYILEE